MVQIFPFQINFGTAQIFGHFLCIIQTAGPSGILIEKCGKFLIKLWIVFVMVVGFFQFDDGIHQCFGDVLTAMDSEASF